MVAEKRHPAATYVRGGFPVSGIRWAAPTKMPTMPLKSDWTMGDLVTASDQNAVADAVNQNTTDIAAAVSALSGKADKATTITAGTGLTGGGDLSANRTLAVSYGATAGTACQGNDSRVTGAVQSGAAGSVIVGTLPASGVAGVLYVVP